MRRLALGLTTFAVLALPGTAHAQTPTPTPSATATITPSVGGDTLGPATCVNDRCYYGTVPTTTDPLYQNWLNEIMPQDAGSRIPATSYSLGYADSGVLHPMSATTGFFMQALFDASVWLVSIATWLLTWAFTFQFASALAGMAADTARLFQTRIVYGLELAHFALFFAIAWCGFQILRGRIMRGAGEMLVTLIIMGVSLYALADPAGLLRGADAQVSNISGAVMSVAVSKAGDTSATPAQVPVAAIPGCQTGPGQSCIATGNAIYEHPEYGVSIQPLKEAISNALIAKPYDILNWKHPLTGACAIARDKILTQPGPIGPPPMTTDGAVMTITGPPQPETAPWDTQDYPRSVMIAAGCTTEATFNARPTLQRTFAAALLLLAAFIVLISLGLIAATVIAAQFVGVGLIMVLPIALAVGMVPSAGRQLLWRWVGLAAKCIVAILALSFLLTFFAIAAGGVLNAFPGPVIVPLFALDILALILFFARKRILHAGQRAGQRIGGHLEGRAVGGSRGGLGMAAAGAAGIGFGVTEHLASERTRKQLAIKSFQYKAMAAGAARRAGTSLALSAATGGASTAVKAVAVARRNALPVSVAVHGRAQQASAAVNAAALTAKARAQRHSASMVASAALRMPSRLAAGSAATVRPAVTALGSAAGRVLPGVPFAMGAHKVRTQSSAVPPAQYYHGTSRPLPDHKLDPDRYMAGSGAYNLFGPGTYVTSDPGVALSYTKKGAKPSGQDDQTVYGINWAGDQPPKLIDLEAPLPPETYDTFLSFFDSTAYEMPDSELTRFAEDMKTKPGSEVYREIRQEMADQEWTRGDADAHLEDLHQVLRDEGYDGFRYQGGKYTKSDIAHEATVFFDPGKLDVAHHTPGWKVEPQMWSVGPVSVADQARQAALAAQAAAKPRPPRHSVRRTLQPKPGSLFAKGATVKSQPPDVSPFPPGSSAERPDDRP